MKANIFFTTFILGLIFIGCDKTDDAEVTVTTADTTVTVTAPGSFVYNGVEYKMGTAQYKSYTHETDSSGKFHSIILLGAGMQMGNGGNVIIGTGPVLYITIKSAAANTIEGDFTKNPTWSDPNDAKTAPINSTQFITVAFYNNGTESKSDYIGGDTKTMTTSTISKASNGDYVIKMECTGEGEVEGVKSTGKALTINFTGTLGTY